MIRPGRRVALFMLTAAAAAGGGYALASDGTAPNPYAPEVSCGPLSRLPTVRGTAPPGVTTVYLAYRDGASVQTSVTRARYTFRLPPPGPASSWPEQLRYIDKRGKQHAIALPRDAFARCAAPIRAVFTTAPPRPQTTEDKAAALVNQASQLAYRTSRACGQQMVPPPRVTLSNGSPSAAMLRVLGVLQRPATAEERAAVRSRNFQPGPPLAVLTVFRRYVRIIHWPSGDTARIVVGYAEESLPKSSLYPCHNAATRILLRLLPGHPSAVQREALRIQHSYKLGPQTHGYHPWLDYQGAGGTAGPFDIAAFRKSGLFIEGSGITPPPPGTNPRAPGATTRPTYRSEIGGLVPDGVATITLELSGKNPHMGAFGRPGEPGLQGFTHPFTATVHVRENTFFFDLPADPNSAARQQMIWRTADGRTIRTVHYP